MIIQSFFLLEFALSSVYVDVMICDPRGGHNRKKINDNFFKSWSPQMAYILGYLYADGVLIDARKSSRTEYVAMSSVDLELLEQIRQRLDSTHKIYMRLAGPIIIRDKHYFRKICYMLRIGNKRIFHDLLKLGLSPRKSLIISLPTISAAYFPYFLRGYFDGDGCVYSPSKSKSRNHLQGIFTCGSKQFLASIYAKLEKYLSLTGGSLCNGDGAFQLRYHVRNALKVLQYMYSDLSSAPYLKRKYQIYQNYLLAHPTTN